MTLRRIVRTILFLILGIMLLLSHVSRRLVHAAENYACFNTDERNADFSDLVRFSFYQYMPPSYDACLNKLRQIDGAKQQWALENNKTSDDTPTWKDLAPYFCRGTSSTNFIHPRCPYGGLYFIGKVGEAPSCTIRSHPRLL